MLYRVRSKRLLLLLMMMEEPDYNLPFRWCVGLNMEIRLTPDDVGRLLVERSR